MEFNRDYLEELARIETPEQEKGISNDENKEQCEDYCYLRSLAKELLSDINNHWTRQRLSDLVIKLGLEENE